MKKVSSALILTNKKVFLGCHSTGNSFYDLPKGQMDGSEKPIDTCIREVREETGLVVKKEQLMELGLHPYTKQKDLYIFVYITNKLPDLKKMDCSTYFVHPYTKEMAKEVDGYKYIPFEEKEKYVTKNMNKVLDEITKTIEIGI